MAEREYRRLTFTRTRNSFAVAFHGRTSLWLGKDHLLCVDSSGYVESYKRFYFRDIQSFAITQSKRGLIWTWVLAGITGLCVVFWMLALFSGGQNTDTTAVNILGAICTAVFAVPLVINVLLGPTCNCAIRTAVQSEELASVARVRRARKVLELIRPLIAEVQGQLVPEEISTRMRALNESTPPVAPAVQPAPAPGAPQPGSPDQPARYVVDDLNAPPRIIP